MEIPEDSRSLIRMLHQTYPHRCLKRGESLEDAQRYAGMRDMIDALMAHLEGEDEDRNF